MVSRYVVDLAQIAGLIVGTMGIFYLSQGLFGQVGTQVLQRTLVACLFAGLFASFLALLQFTDGLMFAHLGQTSANNLYNDHLLVPVGMVAGFFAGYILSAPRKRRTLRSNKIAGYLFVIQGVMFGSLGVWEYFRLQLPLIYLLSSLLLALVFCAFGLVFRAYPRFAFLTGRRLQIIGLTLTFNWRCYPVPATCP